MKFYFVFHGIITSRRLIMLKNNRLKELRKSSLSNKSQIDFHKNVLVDKLKIDISLRTLQNWESGASSIKDEYAQKIAEYFNVSIPYLLGYSEKEKESKEESFERMLLDSNHVNEWNFNYGLQEFESIGGSKEDLYEEILNEYKKKSAYDESIVNPEKHAHKWIKVFMASFGMAPPPTQVVLARYYATPKEKRESIDILLYSLSGYRIKETDKMLENTKGLMNIIE